MKFIFQWLCSKLLPGWMHNKKPDAKHFYRRLFTNAYQNKKQRLTIYWLILGGFLTQINSLPAIVCLLLIATFATFAILDEG
ncbi:hypothetical protein [Spartinivicinus poritis]|uniref:Uncharacterized protein n=1 Tax=Spartinivicinus poritis TaxID=2994640 RepID=A0ABT5UCA6_9GAMM|nr:hypothetical protein [Spartinivicinus sp. A2-2]MDE1463137.1 hypothetical protein [Spartinivicinus sp. A2-2]